MKLTAKATAVDVDERDAKNTGERDWICHICSRSQKGSWCHCRYCCESFPQQAGYDRHHVKHRPADGGRIVYTCQTPDELAASGWQRDPEHAHAWRLPRQGDVLMTSWKTATWHGECDCGAVFIEVAATADDEADAS